MNDSISYAVYQENASLTDLRALGNTMRALERMEEALNKAISFINNPILRDDIYAEYFKVNDKEMTNPEFLEAQKRARGIK